MSFAAPSVATAARWVARPLPVHLHGSVPAEVSGDLARSMRWCLDNRGAAPLTALPSDVDARWIIDWLEGLDRVEGIEQVHASDSRGYDDMPYYRIAEGHELKPADVALERVDQTADAVVALSARALHGHGVPDRVGVSIPNAFDLALFASGSPEAAEEWMPAMQAMVMAEVAEIDRLWGDQVQMRLETPAVLLAYHRTPRADWALLTSDLVQQVAGVLGAAPNADFVLKLCYGDLEHVPLFEPVNLEAAVMFLNALADLLTERGIAVPTVALPIAYGDAAPPTDPAFYAALRRLWRGIDVIAGLVAENHPDESRAALGLVVAALAGPVAAVAASCGFGRRSVAAAAANMALAATVAREWSPVLTR